VTKSTQLSIDQACIAYDKGRLVSAFRAFQLLAEQGDETAFFMLGYIYDTGRGARRSRAKAVHWYLRAFSAGGSSAAIAASNLATVYRDMGEFRQELRWHERAVGFGDGDELVEIGICYLVGKGVRRDPSMAIEHFKAAIQSKHITEAGRDTAMQLFRSCKGWARARVA